MAKILRYVLGLVKTVVLGVSIDGDAIVVRVRPHRREQLRCPVCGRRCECHDHEPTRRWRAMDLARSMCYLEYRPARVRCPEHGVHVERVPWARHRSRFTTDFEDWVACLAVRCCMSAVSRIARVEWHSVGGICGRVYDEVEAQRGVRQVRSLVASVTSSRSRSRSVPWASPGRSHSMQRSSSHDKRTHSHPCIGDPHHLRLCAQRRGGPTCRRSPTRRRLDRPLSQRGRVCGSGLRGAGFPSLRTRIFHAAQQSGRLCLSSAPLRAWRSREADQAACCRLARRPDRIFVMGFSAGGFICASYGNRWRRTALDLGYEPETLRVAGTVLCYPGLEPSVLYETMHTQTGMISLDSITGAQAKMRLEAFERMGKRGLFGMEDPSQEEVDAVGCTAGICVDTPSAFIWGTYRDGIIDPQQLYRFAMRLADEGIPHELHLFGEGTHGLSLGTEQSATKPEGVVEGMRAWLPLSAAWMRRAAIRKSE